MQLSAAAAPRACVRACQGVGLLTYGAVAVDVPIRLETADGSVALEHTAHFTFFPGATPVDARTWPRFWIPVDEFEQVTGIRGVSFGSAQYGSVDFHSSFDFAAGTTSGALYVDKWQNVDSQGTDFALTW